MTNEQKLREFAEKWGIRQNDEPTIDPHTESPYYGYSRRTKQCLSDLTALISEGYYPKEFVEWYHTEGSNDRARIDPYCYMIWVNGEGIGFYTLNEVFNYWKENEQ